MGQTVVPYGSKVASKVQSVGLFAATQQRLSLMSHMTGKMPQQSNAESRLRVQSSTSMPIVQVMDLTKRAGDEVTFDLVNQIGGKPIMGGRMAEGRGEKLSFAQDKLRINQSRKPISAGDTMTQQRTEHDIRGLARAAAKGYMDRLVDQSCLVHLAGARGYHYNIEWAIPLESDPDFAEVLINPIKAPTRNRHFRSMGTGIAPVTATSDMTIATTDIMNTDAVDDIVAMMDAMALPPSGVDFPGDYQSGEAPLRVLLVSSDQFNGFQKSSTWRTLVSNAAARGSKNPIFSGEVGLWNGTLIKKMPKPIRFYAGNTIKYCADANTEVETSVLIPAAFGTTFAVDRALLIGGQALAVAWGRHRDSSAPFFWSEVELDHKDKLEVLIGMINGMSKVRFDVNYGIGAGSQPTDNGVIAIDTAVKISA